MQGPEYGGDSVGLAFDPEEMLRRRRSGSTEQELCGRAWCVDAGLPDPLNVLMGALIDANLDCLMCSMEQAEDDRVVFRDKLWAAEVVPGYEVPGWFVLRVRRHAERLVDLKMKNSHHSDFALAIWSPL